MISQRPFLLLRISFPGRPILIQLVPGAGRVLPPGYGAAGALHEAVVLKVVEDFAGLRKL